MREPLNLDQFMEKRLEETWLRRTGIILYYYAIVNTVLSTSFIVNWVMYEISYIVLCIVLVNLYILWRMYNTYRDRKWEYDLARANETIGV